jgi:glutamine synthetase adenylyltransferase
VHYEALCRRIRDALHALTQDNLLFAPAPRDASPVVASALADFRRELGNAGVSGEPGDLTRAKCIFTFGDATIESQFEVVRSEILAGEGDLQGTDGEPQGSGTYSAETMSPVLEPERGGFDAVERAARQLRLRLAGDDGMRALDSATVFRKAAERGLIDGDAAKRLANAATLWRNLQGIRRLIADGALDVESAKPGVRAAIARSCGFGEFDALS